MFERNVCNCLYINHSYIAKRCPYMLIFNHLHKAPFIKRPAPRSRRAMLYGEPLRPILQIKNLRPSRSDPAPRGRRPAGTGRICARFNPLPLRKRQSHKLPFLAIIDWFMRRSGLPCGQRPLTQNHRRRNAEFFTLLFSEMRNRAQFN